MNQSLTLAPLSYAKEYLANPKSTESEYQKKHATREASRAPIMQEDTCRAWKAYFHACSLSSSRRRLTQLLWKAHTTAIRFALWQYASEFEKAILPKEEIAFWEGWIRLVLRLETLAPFTNDLLLKPLLNVAMPKASPLGGKDAPLEKQSFFKRLFLLFTMRNAVPVKVFIQTYGKRGDKEKEK